MKTKEHRTSGNFAARKIQITEEMFPSKKSLKHISAFKKNVTTASVKCMLKNKTKQNNRNKNKQKKQTKTNKQTNKKTKQKNPLIII